MKRVCSVTHQNIDNYTDYTKSSIFRSPLRKEFLKKLNVDAIILYLDDTISVETTTASNVQEDKDKIDDKISDVLASENIFFIILKLFGSLPSIIHVILFALFFQIFFN